MGYEERVAEVKNSVAKLESAASVALLGAGLVGVELACEIACKFPNKKVLLLDLANRVLPLLPETASQRAEARLQSLGVKLMLGVRSKVDGNVIHLPNGTSFEVDAIFRCF